MRNSIKKPIVLGAGTMGVQVAAHGTKKTLQRIQHTLKQPKPLRN